MVTFSGEVAEVVAQQRPCGRRWLRTVVDLDGLLGSDEGVAPRSERADLWTDTIPDLGWAAEVIPCPT